MPSNEYMSIYMLGRYYERRDRAVAFLGGVCIDCGKSEDLEFDHIHRATKSFDLGKAFASMSWEKILPEVNKCVLRCAPCHMIKTQEENPRTVDHGGGVSGKKNCQCNLCAPLKAEYQKRYNKH